MNVGKSLVNISVAIALISVGQVAFADCDIGDCENGYGTLTLVKSDTDTIAEYRQEGKGHWQGDVYIVQGIFKNGDATLECNSEIDCQKKQAQ